MLRAALALALTLATAANAAQSLEAPAELAPQPQLVQLDAQQRAPLDALCDELEAAAAKTRVRGSPPKSSTRIGGRAPSTAERVCEIFVVEGELVVVAGKYAFAAFDPINGWDPFGLENRCLADPACKKKKETEKPTPWKLQVWRVDENGKPFPRKVTNPNLQYQQDIAMVGATTGTEAALNAQLPSVVAQTPGLWFRIKDWFGKLFRPKPPVITPPIKDAVGGASANATNEATVTTATPPEPAAAGGGGAPKYGPYHRRGSAAEGEMVKEAGELAGLPPRNIHAGGLGPLAKAWDGPLPAGQTGYEFFSPIKAEPWGSPGGWVGWSPERIGVRVGVINGQEAVFVPVEVTKIVK